MSFNVINIWFIFYFHTISNSFITTVFGQIFTLQIVFKRIAKQIKIIVFSREYEKKVYNL